MFQSFYCGNKWKIMSWSLVLWFLIKYNKLALLPTKCILYHLQRIIRLFFFHSFLYPHGYQEFGPDDLICTIISKSFGLLCFVSGCWGKGIEVLGVIMCVLIEQITFQLVLVPRDYFQVSLSPSKYYIWDILLFLTPPNMQTQITKCEV